MPLITVSGPALDVERKRDLARGLTEVASKAYGHPPGHIIVTIQETPPENVSIGGELVADRGASSS
jgi:4-oxalocrotonate tautomerase